MEKLVPENEYEILVPLFGAAFAAPNKGTIILYWFRSLSTVFNSTENRRIQGLFKAFEWFSSTFQGRFNFQGLFKKAIYIQVLFKPVWTLVHLFLKAHTEYFWGCSSPQQNLSLGFLTKSDSNQSPQLPRLQLENWKFAWSKFRYNTFQQANNKGTDQTATIMCTEILHWNFKFQWKNLPTLWISMKCQWNFKMSPKFELH